MLKTEVHSVVLAQVGGQWNRSNLHGVNLKACLVEPELIEFTTVAGESTTKAWIVLREHPDKPDGYAVVFDELTRSFGLAQFASGFAPCLFGIYGDFFAALEAM